MHSLEFKKLLEKFVPNYEKGINGASEEEIAKIEKLSGCKIPKFYHWFLSRMGLDMGEISFPTIDFTVTKITQCYQDMLVKPDPQYLLIGYESKEGALDIYYDLGNERNGDAPVMRRNSKNDENEVFSETFCEFLSWTIVLHYSIEKYPEICKGVFIDDDSDDEGDVLLQLNPIMRDLGFDVPIQTGKYCGIYIGHTVTLITDCPPDEDAGYHGFSLGGVNREELRKILYEIERGTSLEIEVDVDDPRSLNYSE